MTIKSNILFPLITISITACATGYYEAPSSTTDSAKVRFTLETSGTTRVKYYEDSLCNGGEAWLTLKDQATPNQAPTRLGIPLWAYHNNSAKELAVESDKKHYFLFKGQKKVDFMAINCSVPVITQFEKGQNYELRYSAGMHTCQVELKKIQTSTNGNITSTTVQRFKNPKNINKNNCFDLFKH